MSRSKQVKRLWKRKRKDPTQSLKQWVRTTHNNNPEESMLCLEWLRWKQVGG